jgi:hypothetical protein
MYRIFKKSSYLVPWQRKIILHYIGKKNFVLFLISKWSLKKDLVHLRSKFFSRQIFLLYFGKWNFGGKNYSLKKKILRQSKNSAFFIFLKRIDDGNLKPKGLLQ